MASILSLRNISKHFGTVKAIDGLDLNIEEGTFHAIMGENGAGKSTVAKCIMGLHTADEGEIMVRGEVANIRNPKEAHSLGIGMVYQHFMLVDNMTVAENLILAREKFPFVFNWNKETRNLRAFIESMPFRLDLATYVRNLSAGEKQKLEILKMLYLECKVLILDEPTSVLTPAEADSILSFLKQFVASKKFTVIMITHKFREVFGYADTLSVLRKGQYIGGGKVSDFTKAQIATLMVGAKINEIPAREKPIHAKIKMKVDALLDKDELGVTVLNKLSLHVKQGEIYGVAGVSGNGQKRLVEILAGQRKPKAGHVLVDDRNFDATRRSIDEFKFYCLPEEPLRNACVAEMSIAENMALRYFDKEPFQKRGVVSRKNINHKAEELIGMFNVKTPSPDLPIRSLSGGNVQRTVLARELSGDASVLVISNPCFGLDFNATADIRAMLLQARNNGTAILLLSEDLDEIIELSDRIGVIFNGAIVYETQAAEVDINILGEKMAGN
ncbi:MAG TPA: ABC transporter ATP-binding protein [Chryseolinea sp.]|nr:ABC transporter ATP-binding protein [Chryseolinea sp.]